MPVPPMDIFLMIAKTSKLCGPFGLSYDTRLCPVAQHHILRYRIRFADGSNRDRNYSRCHYQKKPGWAYR